MSSVRTKTKLGLTGVVWTAVGGPPVMAEKNRTANAAEANSTARRALIKKLTLLIPSTLLLKLPWVSESRLS
jgi:hypothetical protein